MFLICHTPRNIMNWYEFITVDVIVFCNISEQKHEPPYWTHILFMLGGLTIFLNSSLNFIVYCFVGRKFRRELFQIFKFNQTSSSNEIQNEVTRTTGLPYCAQSQENTLVMHQSKTDHKNKSIGRFPIDKQS